MHIIVNKFLDVGKVTRAYKNVKDHNKKSGNNKKKSFEFESQMDDFFGDEAQEENAMTTAAIQRKVTVWMTALDHQTLSDKEKEQVAQ